MVEDVIPPLAMVLALVIGILLGFAISTAIDLHYTRKLLMMAGYELVNPRHNPTEYPPRGDHE